MENETTTVYYLEILPDVAVGVFNLSTPLILPKQLSLAVNSITIDIYTKKAKAITYC